MDSFRTAAAERNICIDGEVNKINRRWTDDQFKYNLTLLILYFILYIQIALYIKEIQIKLISEI